MNPEECCANIQSSGITSLISSPISLFSQSGGPDSLRDPQPKTHSVAKKFFRHAVANSTVCLGIEVCLSDSAKCSLQVNVHSCHIRFAIALHHAQELPPIPFVEAGVVSDQIDRRNTV